MGFVQVSFRPADLSASVTESKAVVPEALASVGVPLVDETVTDTLAWSGRTRAVARPDASEVPV